MPGSRPARLKAPPYSTAACLSGVPCSRDVQHMQGMLSMTRATHAEASRKHGWHRESRGDGEGDKADLLRRKRAATALAKQTQDTAARTDLLRSAALSESIVAGPATELTGGGACSFGARQDSGQLSCSDSLLRYNARLVTRLACSLRFLEQRVLFFPP